MECAGVHANKVFTRFVLYLGQFTRVNLCQGHNDRVGGVAWHPQATLSLSEGAANLVSGAGDGQVNLWSLNR